MINKKVLATVMAIGFITITNSYAATLPGSITAFDELITNDTFIVKSKGWSDPAFGDMGWTHSSDWGSFNATQGQAVSITLVAAEAGIHPGATIWFRGANDTAPDNYVVDHFYPQNANFVTFGATDENTGAGLGNIVMKHIRHGYDADGNSVISTKMGVKKDNVAGKLVFRFKAPYTGSYMFVVGGFNPDTNIDNSLKYNIDVKVKIK